ncbi:hypothetical protein CKJ89_38455, partial [Klebsiella pneumoniae]
AAGAEAADVQLAAKARQQIVIIIDRDRQRMAATPLRIAVIEELLALKLPTSSSPPKRASKSS